MKMNFKALIGLTAVATSAFVMTSCSDDKDPVSPSAASSTGTSSVTNASSTGTSSVVAASSTVAGSSVVAGSSSSVVVKAFCDGKTVPASTTINSNITADVCLTADKVWALDGHIQVQTGATLYIEPGTRIESLGDTYLQINQGAKIIADGTAAKPIVFTSKNDKVGGTPLPNDWDGIVIVGKAKVSTLEATGTLPFEADPSVLYGGNDDADNSGVLRYVQVAYAGKVNAANIEYNAISLLGVGSGTTIDYVHVHAPKDDAIEAWGGTVAVKHLLVTEGNDDGFDVDSGFRGSLQYGLFIGKRSTNAGVDEGSDNGVEVGGDIKNTAMPTDITATNVTVITGTNTAKNTSAGFQNKKGSKVKFSKFVVVQGASVDGTLATINLAKLDADAATNDPAWADGSSYITNSFYQGTWTSKYNSSAVQATADKVTAGFTASTGALNADLSPKDAAIVTAGAGAIVGGDLWYKGWSHAFTLPTLARKKI